MKLLFDENLSPRLIKLLADIYPRSVHVRDIKLQSASDGEIWDYAASNHLTIISKDNDFHQRSFLSGHPPKVIWIGRDNCSTAEVSEILRVHRAGIDAFELDPLASFLALE